MWIGINKGLGFEVLADEDVVDANRMGIFSEWEFVW